MWDPFRYKLGGRLLNRDGEEFTARYGVSEDGRYVITRDVATYAIVKEVEAGRGSPHGGAYLSLPALLGGGAARRVRPGDRPARAERHRSDQDAGRGRADRALPHGRRRRRRTHGDRGAGPAGRRRGGRRRQRRQPAVRQRHHRGAGVRPPRRPQRRRARQRPGRAAVPAACGARRARSARVHGRPPRHQHRRDDRRRCRPRWRTTSGRSAPRPSSSARSRRSTISTSALGPRPVGDGGPFDLRALDWFDLRNMLMVAQVVTQAALARTESRGAHQREDHPGMLPEWRAQPGGAARGRRHRADAARRRRLRRPRNEQHRHS